jgi:FtsZ-binding cell division protein ZapB
MEILGQLEQKIHGLVAQRNRLHDELGRAKAEHGGHETEMKELRARVDALQSENDALLKERDDVRQQVESILQKTTAALKQIEGLQ